MPAKDKIQDIYALSPLQEGLLYHNLVTDAGSYVVQTAYQLQGAISPDLVEQSLERLFLRYDILRTAFVHEGLSKMVQVVLKERLPEMQYKEIEREDDIDGFIETYLEQDRLRGFDLAKDVLMRVALFRTAQGAYTFVWSYHHILMDGWCTAILIREFNEIYRSLMQGTELQLPPVTQFGAFIQWLEKQDKAAAQAFWKNYLSGYETPSRIPGAVPATPSPFLHREVVNVLPPELQSKLQERCLELRITLSTLLQTAWGLLLGRYNDCRDVVYGTVSTLRPPGIRGIETMVGLFINTVPLRLCWQPGDRFADLATAHQQGSLETRSYEYCSLADVQSSSCLRNQLFDHLLVISSAPALSSASHANTHTEGGAGISSVRSLEQVNYPFSINITQAAELTIRFTYNARIFRQELVNRLSKNFTALLEQVAADPFTAIDSLDCISTDEAKQLAVSGEGPVRTYTGTIDSLFSAVAARYPEAVAIQSGEALVTYQELNHNSTMLAIGLESRGLRPGAPVALVCHRSATWVTGLLAIWKAGGIYVPLERAHPDSRLEFILSETGTRFLLTDESQAERAPGYSCQRINIDQPDRRMYPYGTTCPGSREDSLAYLIYTSGTSGQPKGVPITQANLVERILWHNEYLEVTAADRMLQFASMAFDASLVEILMPLLCGGRLLLPDEVRNNTNTLVQYLDDNEVSMAILPPAYLRLMDRAPLPCLTKIISTGEAASLEEMIWYGSERAVYNGYGPTETCVGASFHRVNSSNAAGYRLQRSIPIGRPFANTLIRVLDRDGRLSPLGAEGEICVGGPHLTQGYWHQPDLSSEKFMRDPHASSGRLYRTGDLGCWNEEGELEYRGRLDEQVQIHGIRVETAEIEQVIKKFEGVHDAVVRLWKEEGDVQLAAYLVATDSLDVDALRSALQKSLPYYMVPGSLQILSSFPLTPNGKLDVRALPKPAPRLQSTFAEPQTASEKTLSLLWEKILEKRIGITDNFFVSGGHSIKGIKLITLIEKEFKVVLTLENIFQYPTILELAKFIDATLWVSAVPATRTGEVESLII